MARTPVQRIDPDLQRLFDDVLASPDDDTPRLVLADALMERGDLRGELIAIQCARSDADDAVDRVNALLDEYEGRWTEGLGPKALSYGFHRGFVEEVRGPTEVLSRYVPKLARVTPIRRVVVTKLDIKSISAFLAALEEARVRSLTLKVPTVPELASAFRESKLPEQLEELRLAWDGEQMLAARMPGLRSLSFETYYRSAPRELLSLEAPLEHLELTHFATWLGELGKARFRQTLRSLVLSHADLGVLAKLDLPSLVSVDVDRVNDVSPRDVTAFERSPAPLRRAVLLSAAEGPLLRRLLVASPSIEGLDVSHCEGAGVVTTLELPRLTELRARSTNFDVAALLRSPLAARLRVLELDSNDLGDEGAVAIANANLPELRVLHLREAGIGAVGAAAFASSSTLPLLRDLDLSENPIGEDGAIALANANRLQRIARLALHDVRVGMAAGRALKTRFGGALEKSYSR